MAYRCHGAVTWLASINPEAIIATPSPITARGPWRSISQPSVGLSSAETTKPKENAPAMTPRSQPNSPRIGGNSSENAVRALTPMPVLTKATATMIQP